MNTFASKFVAIVLSLLLLAYIGYQVFTVFYNPYESEIVKMGSYTQNIDVEGFFVRDEVKLEQKKQGIVNYLFEDGDKIPKEAVIADVYASQNDVFNIKKVQRLEAQKTVLERSQSGQSGDGLKLDMLTNQVNLLQLDLLGQINNGDLASVHLTGDELTYNLNKIATCIDSTVSFDQAIANIDAQIVATNANISTVKTPVVSTESGYFSSFVDGYESVFTPAMLKDLTVDKMETLLSNKKSATPTNIGKLQNNSSWYFVALVDNRYVENIPIAKTVKLNFNSKTSKSVDAVVENVITQKDETKSVLVLHSEYLDADFMEMRFESPQISIGDYSGIVIPKEAVRFATVKKTVVNEVTNESETVEKNVKGVYTLLGKSVRFKELDIMYEDNYVVVSKQNVKSNYVSVYDKVILKGKDLNVSEKQ